QRQRPEHGGDGQQTSPKTERAPWRHGDGRCTSVHTGDRTWPLVRGAGVHLQPHGSARGPSAQPASPWVHSRREVIAARWTAPGEATARTRRALAVARRRTDGRRRGGWSTHVLRQRLFQ